MYKKRNIVIIFFIVVCLFLFNLNINHLYHTNIVPSGDPFSYTVNLIHLHKNLLTNYIYYIGQTFASSQWYYAYKLPLIIFAHVIPFETYFYYIINYFYFFIYVVSFFYFLQTFQDNLEKNLIISFLLAVFPFLAGFKSSISLNLLMLDTQFFLLSLSFFSLCLAFLKRQELFLSLLLSIVGGLLIWSRGNSIFYVLIFSFFPVIFYFLKLKNKTIKFNVIYLAIPIFTLLVFFAWYMYFCYDALTQYYSVHSNLINSHNYSFTNLIKNFIKILINYPGKLITENNNLAFYISIFVNLFLVIFSISIIFIKKIKEIAPNYYSTLIICCFTYFLILVFLTINLSPWLDVNFYVDHATITMLVPLICISAMLIQFIFFKFKINSFIFTIIIVLIFLQNNKLNRQDYNKLLSNYSKDYPNLVKPKELESFAMNVFKETNNKKIGILFYNFYNPPILDFYRLQNNLLPASMSTENVSQVIRPIAGDPELYVSREEYKQYLKNVLVEYDYLIMPLYFEEYSKIPHLLISKYQEETIKVLKEHKDKFLPIKILNDSIQLVLLKKIDPNDYDDLAFYYPDINENKIALLPDDKFLPNKLNNMKELFDNNLSSFYEKHYLNKIELEIYLKNKVKLNSYSFEFGKHFPESITRLPKNWSLKAYNRKEKNWITLDEKKDYIFKKTDFMNFPTFNLENIHLSDKFKIIITNNKQNHNILRIYNLKLNNGNKFINNEDVIKTKFKIIFK
jgi:hypothetical protein